MSIWRIKGGAPLTGSMRIQGAKNSVLPIMAASILAGCDTELLNCPELSDVRASIAILEHLGCGVKRENDVVSIASGGMNQCEIPHSLMKEMRSSVIFLGAILARCGEAVLSLPGGCELGPRPIDLHLKALRELGAEVEAQGGNIVCRAKKLKGARINFSIPSVGATENAMIAACGAEGTTIIQNAAREPEIVDLQDYLIKLGADIEGAGSPTIVVHSFKPKPSVGHRVMPDRIVASTFLCAVASTGGDIELMSVDPEHFETVSASLEEMGCLVMRRENRIRLISNGCLKSAKPISTKPFPGFPTDAQPNLMAACLKAKGTTVFVENIFENRFRHVDELKRLGADIKTEGRVAMVTGVKNLAGCPMTTTDLRGGAALVTAALCADGETLVDDAGGHIDRGYEALDDQLRELGADVQKI